MKWVVVLPGALVPAAMASDLAHALETRVEMNARFNPLLYATRAPDESWRAMPPAAVHWQWLWQAFGGAGKPVVAPYLAEPVQEGQCWLCEPIHIEIGRELRIGRRADAQADAAENDALAGVAAEALRGQAALDARHGRPWLLRPAAPWQLDTIALAAARGRSLSECLAAGPDAPRWQRLLNDIQMRWHEHPVNQARAAAGRPAINGLWLHGGGVRAALPKRPFDRVDAEAASEPILRGWMRAAEVGAGAQSPRGADAVSLYSELAEPAAFECWNDWLEAFAAVAARIADLRRRAFADGYARVDVLLGGRRAIRALSLGRRDPLRFWRKPHALAGLLAEPAP